MTIDIDGFTLSSQRDFTDDPTPAHVIVDVATSPDGTILYLLDDVLDSILQYDLDPAWDVSSASLNTSFYVGAHDESTRGMYFRSDGALLLTQGSSTDQVFSFTLSTPWDVSSASLLATYAGIWPASTASYGIAAKPDGTRVFVGDFLDGEIRQYDMSSAWDITTASYAGVHSTGPLGPFRFRGIHITDDGTQAIYGSGLNNLVYDRRMSTAWDIETLDDLGISRAMDEPTQVWPVHLDSAGDYLVLVDTGPDVVYVYSGPVPVVATPLPQADRLPFRYRHRWEEIGKLANEDMARDAN